MTWQGTWTATSTYNVNDAVAYNGASYINTTAGNSGIAPPNGGWDLLAGQGEAGPGGVTGSTGPSGATGPAGNDPPGTVVAYAGSLAAGPPPGWLACDGSAVSRTTYAALFAAIGTGAGDGDGSTTFNLPDYRGLFLRGLDSGAGRDPDVGTRTAMKSGGNTGDAVNSVEGFAVQSHTHAATDSGHSHSASDSGHSHGASDSGHVHIPDVSPASDQTQTFVSDNCATQYCVPSQSCGASGLRGYCDATSTAIGYANVTISTGYAAVSVATGHANIVVSPTGSSETRSVNAAVSYLIKY